MKYVAIISFVALVLIWLSLFNNTNQVNTISLKSHCDSISDMNFEYENRINRYELTLEILREENPKLAKEFEEIMYTQTE